MYDMFCQRTAVNHNIIEVQDDQFVFHSLQNAVHHPHKLAGCIRQAKRQDSPLIHTKCSGEGCLLPVGCSDTNLILTSHQAQFGEPSAAVHGVEQVLDMWKRIMILDGYGVYCMIIYTHTQCTVRLWHERSWLAQIASRGLNPTAPNRHV
jgi:hypothetical protein